MDFSRARESDFKYIKYEKSLMHNTALIAHEEDEVIGILEYDVNNIEEAEIVNFNIYPPCKGELVFKGLIEELVYWHPYLKTIIYNQDNNVITRDMLKYAGFREKSFWVLDVNNNIQVFRIGIEEVTPEQLTVSKAKVDKVSAWIEKPEDIVITCVEIGEKVVCIDGYSRLVAAYIKDFKYVYAYLEKSDRIEFYKTCMAWCEEQKIFTIKDLVHRIVTEEEHERIWISKCQAYLRENVNS